MCIAYTHDRTRISFKFLFIQNIYILFENERGWDFVLYHLFILFSSICLNEAVAQLTDEQRWWRHRVRCCSNRRYVLACSQVCAWSTDLPSTCLQVIESVVRVLGIEKRPESLVKRRDQARNKNTSGFYDSTRLMRASNWNSARATTDDVSRVHEHTSTHKHANRNGGEDRLLLLRWWPGLVNAKW